MFLKRILTAALGALGLGAFAAGTASAQNIPAPDIFDDQITCSMNVPSAMNTPMPSVVPMGATMSPLDTLIGDGMTAIDTTVTGGTFEDLGYVIPAGGTNCGLGTGSNPFVATGMNADGDPAEGAIPFDVADGYTRLLTAFQVAYGDPADAMSTGAKGALDAANSALAMGIAMGTTGAALTALEEAVTRAEKAYNTALAAFNAISTDPNNPSSLGPIYDAGKAEWMAKAVVTKAVVDYNTQVTDTNAAQTTLDAMNYADNYLNGATPDAADSLWVPLGNTELFDTASTTTVVSIDAMGMATVNINQLIQYVNGDLNNPQVGMAAVAGMGTGDGTTGNEAPVASDVTASNFTAAGVLIIPMEADTTTTDDLTDLRNTTSATNAVSDIRTIVENANIAAAALKKARDEFTGLPQTQAIYDEAYRRAQLEANYYNARWAEVLAYSRDTRTALQKLEYLDTDGSGVNEAAERTEGNRNTAYIATPTSIASRNAALTTEQNKRFMREQDLRAAVSTREAATAAVRTAFTDPQDFYDQLVAKRNAVKAAADKAVADATTPSVTQTTAQENAAKALGEANTKKMAIDALFDDPNDPTEALVAELLKGDDDGDDGQALVNAISSNYDAVNALTAEDDPSTLEDESGVITQLKEQVDGLMGDGSGLGALEDKVNALTAMDDPDTMEDETGAVTRNSNEITSLDGRVADNERDIGQIQTDLYGDTSGQHDGLAACDATGLLNVATCADARSRHNEEEIDGIDDKLKEKAEYIGNLGEAIGLNAETDEGTVMLADGTMGTRIDKNAEDIAAEAKARVDGDAETLKAANEAAMMGDAETLKAANEAAMMGDAETLKAANDAAMMGDAETLKAANDAAMMGDAETLKAANDAAMMGDAEVGRAFAAADSMLRSSLTDMIGSNTTMINDNRRMIGELSDDLDVVRAGVAASMALAGMPAINGRGIAIGVGSYDGESAFAVGFQIQGEQASFKIGVTSSGGETGASAGVGFNF